jgi:hypothetical protein
MVKPLEERTDDELQRVAAGELGDKKAIIAQEILRRRQETKTQELKSKYRWLGSMLAALSLAFLAFKRIWRR